MNALGRWPQREVPRLTAGEPIWILGAGNLGPAVAHACAAYGVGIVVAHDLRQHALSSFELMPYAISV